MEEALVRESRLGFGVEIKGVESLVVDRRTRRVIELDVAIVNTGGRPVGLSMFPYTDLLMCYMLSDGSRYCRWVPHISVSQGKPYWEVVESGFESATRSGLAYVLGTEVINPDLSSDDSPNPRGAWDPGEVVIAGVFFDRNDEYAPYYNYDETGRRGLLIGGFFTITFVLPNGVLAMHNTFTDVGEVLVVD